MDVRTTNDKRTVRISDETTPLLSSFSDTSEIQPESQQVDEHQQASDQQQSCTSDLPSNSASGQRRNSDPSLHGSADPAADRSQSTATTKLPSPNTGKRPRSPNSQDRGRSRPSNLPEDEATPPYEEMPSNKTAPVSKKSLAKQKMPPCTVPGPGESLITEGLSVASTQQGSENAESNSGNLEGRSVSLGTTCNTQEEDDGKDDDEYPVQDETQPPVRDTAQAPAQTRTNQPNLVSFPDLPNDVPVRLALI